MNPLVSVLIPTLGNPNPETLESIRNQTYKNVEIVITKPTGERSCQLNEEAKKARGSYLYRIDEDYRPNSTVIQEAVEKCESGFDAITVHNTSDPSISRWSKVRKVERDCFRDDPDNSFARFFRKDAFHAVGGYDERLYAEEDRDLHERLVRAGFRIGRIDSWETHVGEPKSLKEVVRHYAYYGPSIHIYLRQSGIRTLAKLGPFKRAFVRHWKEIAKEPVLMCEFLLYQLVRYASAVAAMSVQIPPKFIFQGGSGSTYGSVIVGRELKDITLEIPGSVKVAGPMSLNEARNMGAICFPDKDFIAFIDDDNKLAPDALDEMSKTFRLDDRIGAVSPLIFDRNGAIWFAGVRWTSFGMSLFNHTMPRGYRWTEAFHDVFMVRRCAFEKAGGFDSHNFPFYLGEADLAERMSKLGYRFLVNPKARVWHDVDANVNLKNLTRASHMRTQKRAFLVGRNRSLFIRKHKGPLHFLLYVLMFLPFITFVHLAGTLYRRQIDMVIPYMKGTLSGLIG